MNWEVAGVIRLSVPFNIDPEKEPGRKANSARARKLGLRPSVAHAQVREFGLAC